MFCFIIGKSTDVSFCLLKEDWIATVKLNAKNWDFFHTITHPEYTQNITTL